ncbi:hypothetical protein P879_00384 [Paragonimus westermani]|uniref:Cadherin domain-containing protein n=1 Tax=Paragonimus westermani TaxID=34504 RepID=A0A8T0E0I7_9TREM|nr:hypothetical protein P879_00384 [Paragonimus westermani]
MAEPVGIFEGHLPEIMVPENISVGSTVLRDFRTHLNLPPKSLVKLSPGSLTQFFRLDAESGQLISMRSVDLESPEMCEAEKSCCRVELNGLSTSIVGESHLAPRGSLSAGTLNDHSPLQNERRMTEESKPCRLMAFVLASSTVESQLAPISKLYITVIDLNDNPPVFKTENTNLRYELSETMSSPPKIHVAFLEGSGGLNSRQDLVLAYDADFSVTNRVKRYWLEWGETDKENLTPTASGSISSIRSSNPLNVDDQNGLTWSILGPFRLIYLEAGRTLALELDMELDRERQRNYHMRLIAEDGGNLRGELRILVDVIDINEFAPIFVDEFRTGGLQLPLHRQSAMYQKHYTLKESLPLGTEVGRLRATDEDDSPDKVITYRLGPGNPQNEVSKTFHLNPTTGSLVLVGLLDYERTKRYRLTVIAQDGPSVTYGSNSQAVNDQFQKTGTTYRSTTGIVEITVTDVNDNAPVIRFEKDNKMDTGVEPGTSHTRTSAHHEVWIKEDIVKGSPVTYFSTLDPDSAENGRVSCNLLNWTDRFRLREFTGLYGIETVTEFDRETTDVYYVTIKCQDQGVPQLQNSQILIIHVEDVNDLPPSFSLPVYQFHVLEDSTPGTPLLPVNANYPAAVTATDPDLNSTIVYRLEPLDPNRAINMETRLGSAGSSSIMDHLLFQIDPRLATLTTQGELDRETRAILAFHVCADDGKHSACTDVTVILDDVNDNRPIFDRDTYVLRVEENQLSSRPLVVFRVTDADINNQGFIFEFVNDGKTLSKITSSAVQKTNGSEFQQYKTQFEPGSVQHHFALRENTLYLRRPLDRELRSSYHFFIRVVDVHDFSPIREFVKAGWTVNHPQNLTSQAEIFVDVGDVNDNAPVLIFPNSTGPLGNRLTVSCHETMGSAVGRLQATDMDLGQNASVLFTLIHTPEVDQLFYLDTNSGELFVNTGQLEERCGQSAIMVVSADDQGSIESKKSRAAPVERLLIKLEDKPTLAEVIAAESRYKLRYSGDSAVGSAVQNRDSSTIYSGLSARAILSVVLGGSTVFLIGLLIVWMILLVYNRSKRQKRLNQLQLTQTKRQPHNAAADPQVQATANSPERILYGTISSEERCASLPSQTDRTTWSVPNSEKPCGKYSFNSVVV